MIYLACLEGGRVLDIIKSKEGETFDDVYKKTVGKNKAQILIELDEMDIEEIKKLSIKKR